MAVQIKDRAIIDDMVEGKLNSDEIAGKIELRAEIIRHWPEVEGSIFGARKRVGFVIEERFAGRPGSVTEVFSEPVLSRKISGLIVMPRGVHGEEHLILVLSGARFKRAGVIKDFIDDDVFLDGEFVWGARCFASGGEPSPAMFRRASDSFAFYFDGVHEVGSARSREENFIS